MDPVPFVVIVSMKEVKIPQQDNSRIMLENLHRILPDNAIHHQEMEERLGHFQI
jgi:hypothetical protein